MQLRILSDLRIKQQKYSPYPDLVQKVLSPLRRGTTRKQVVKPGSSRPHNMAPPVIVISRSTSTYGSLSDDSSSAFEDIITVIGADEQDDDSVRDAQSAETSSMRASSQTNAGNSGTETPQNPVIIATVTYDLRRQQEQLNERRALEQLRTQVDALETERARLHLRLSTVSRKLAEARAADKVRLAKDKVTKWRGDSDQSHHYEETRAMNVSEDDSTVPADDSPQFTESTLYDDDAAAGMGTDKNSTDKDVTILKKSDLEDHTEFIRPSTLSASSVTTPSTNPSAFFDDDTTALAILSHWDDILLDGLKQSGGDTSEITCMAYANSQSLLQLEASGALAQQRRMRPAVTA